MLLFSKIWKTGIATEILQPGDPAAVEIGRALELEIPLRRTYEATASPKFVVAVGDCAKTCGVFKDSYAVVGPIDRVIPVDISIAGCPPEPTDILRGILEGLDRFSEKRGTAAPTLDPK